MPLNSETLTDHKPELDMMCNRNLFTFLVHRVMPREWNLDVERLKFGWKNGSTHRLSYLLFYLLVCAKACLQSGILYMLHALPAKYLVLCDKI
jgi:hypothetical protein